MAKVPPQQLTQVAFRLVSWKALAVESWGSEWAERDTAYEFTGRDFEDSGPTSGIYRHGTGT